MGSIAEQNHVLVKPVLIAHAHEIHPRRAKLMGGVEEQTMSLQPAREHLLAGGDGLVGVHTIKTGIAPGELIAFHDESRIVFIEAITVRLKNSTLVHDEVEGKGLELVSRPQPYELCRPDFHVGLEEFTVLLTNAAIDAIGGDDQIQILNP